MRGGATAIALMKNVDGVAIAVDTLYCAFAFDLALVSGVNLGALQGVSGAEVRTIAEEGAERVSPGRIRGFLMMLASACNDHPKARVDVC